MKNTPSVLGMATVNDKGQVVIPAEARATINIKAGDKLLVMVHPSHEGVVFVKPDGLESFVAQLLDQVKTARRNQEEIHE